MRFTLGRFAIATSGWLELNDRIIRVRSVSSKLFVWTVGGAWVVHRNRICIWAWRAR